jgi:hypothetical protein
MYEGVIIAQVLLTFILGLWVASHFKDSAFIKFFGRNDWFVGALMVTMGYINFAIYEMSYVRNLNLVLVVVGLILVLFSLIDLLKKRR